MHLTNGPHPPPRRHTDPDGDELLGGCNRPMFTAVVILAGLVLGGFGFVAVAWWWVP